MLFEQVTVIILYVLWAVDPAQAYQITVHANVILSMKISGTKFHQDAT